MRNTNVSQADSGGGYGGDSQWYEERQWCREQIRYYQGLENQYRAELDNLENDFAILSDQENNLVMNIVICENTIELVGCLFTSIENINVIVDENHVPGFEELFDFSGLDASGSCVNNLKSENEKYISDLKNICQRIDELKTEVAKKIDDTSDEYYDAINWRMYYEDLLRQYSS